MVDKLLMIAVLLIVAACGQPVHAWYSMERVRYAEFVDPVFDVSGLRQALVQDGIAAITNVRGLGKVCGDGEEEETCLEVMERIRRVAQSVDKLVTARIAQAVAVNLTGVGSLGEFVSGSGEDRVGMSKGALSLLIPQSASSKITVKLLDGVKILPARDTVFLLVGQEFAAKPTDHETIPLNPAQTALEGRWFEKVYMLDDGSLSMDMPMPSGNGFCNGMSMSMYMDGFTWAGDEKKSCLTLLFPSIVLDSAAKFVFGVLFCFCFGIFIEFLLKQRRSLATQPRPICKRKYKLARSCLYTIQILCGYTMMLFVMTYSTPIFIASVIGLVVGHVAFNLDQPIPEFSDPCCQVLLDEELSSTGELIAPLQ
mmetsp:Transcript_18192/g.29565  ORF Transcript_18192/g.29565 Transcript_18192/m.29565 type:complete len:368 (-) Transcript_18192:48-1151(-)